MLSALRIPVDSIPFETPARYITNFSYAINDFDLFDQITFRIYLFDQYGNVVSSDKLIELNTNEYADWKSDDLYMSRYIAEKAGFTIDASALFQLVKKQHLYPKRGTDLSGNIIRYTDVMLDLSGYITLPYNYTTDVSNNILDISGNIVSYRLLNYNYDGNAYVSGGFSLDGSNNPIFTNGYTTDAYGIVRDASGQHIVIVAT